jgi:hypothetical protein
MFLVLITVAAVNTYKMIDNQEENYYRQEAYKQSAVLATALMQEIVRKKFDSRVDTSASIYVPDPTNIYAGGFDPPGSLGPGATATAYVNPGGAADVSPYKSINGINSNFFDDVDDYKGYYRSASAGNLTGFTLTVDVYYVRLRASDSTYVKANTNATYWKKVDIAVRNSKYLTMKDSVLTYSTIIAY